VAGKCSATAPSGDAVKKSGPDPDDVTGFILPDGRRLHPAGHEHVFADVAGGLTSQVVDVPGTPFAITVETGYGDHAVRSVDVTKLAAGMDPVVDKVAFTAPETLGYGLAVVGARIFVASSDGVVQALDLDLATGALTRDDVASIPLPPGPKGNLYVSGVAATPDGQRLVVTGADDAVLHVFSIAADATYGQKLGTVALADKESFGVWIDPHDPTGNTAYVSLWASKAVQAIDLGALTVKATYATGKNPEGIAFLDARFLVVAEANGDSFAVVDRTTGTVTHVPIEAAASALPGGEPSVPAVDPLTGRLYVTLGGDNAVAAFTVDTTQAAPVVTRVGLLGTGWWPSGVVVRGDGALVVTSLRGHGGGPIPMPFGFGDSDIGERMKGSVQWIPKPAAPELGAGATAVAADDDAGTRKGAPAVACPPGASDFPLPPTNQGGSPVIDHVFFILRENKNFDALFGDLAGVDGEPTYTLKAQSADMDSIWHNLRTLARGFAVSDAYYTDAVFSTQGHVLATYGRSSDFNERTWAISGARGGSPRGVPGGGVTEVGRPQKSLFEWLIENDVPLDILGEADGDPQVTAGEKSPLDGHYPGVVQAITANDLPKACYAAGRVRVACDVGKFVYQTLPNDHTVGLSADNPSPEVMCAVNDEATGIMLDAISHSPFWKSSLVIITEDDPSSGGEHVDGHRTPIVFVSPWVKRGYVSKTHIDVASLHRMYAHVFGKPYLNRQVAGAMLPFDLFTSTPDYTPYTYTPRSWPLSCGAVGGPVPPGEAELTAMWDFSHEDRQPGLGAQVVRAMRGKPLEVLTPAMRARAVRWQAQARDDDD
jgi:DNA-binding beta-propeller fold protein YncE